MKYLVLFDFLSLIVFKTHGNKVYLKRNVVVVQKCSNVSLKFAGC